MRLRFEASLFMEQVLEQPELYSETCLQKKGGEGHALDLGLAASP